MRATVGRVLIAALASIVLVFGVFLLQPRKAPVVPPLETIGVRVPKQGIYRWLPNGWLEITLREQRTLWNPATGKITPSKPLPLPPGVYKRDHLDWSSSPDGKWLLVTQRRYEQPVEVEGLLPVAQRRWLLTPEGACVGTKDPPYKPLESDPLWLKDSAGWITTTDRALLVHSRLGDEIQVSLPELKERWYRFPVAALADGRALVAEQRENGTGGGNSAPLEHVQFRTVSWKPRVEAGEPIGFPFLLGTPTLDRVPLAMVSVAPDGKRVALQYVVSTIAPGQRFWGRFIAGPEPRNQHFEVWITALEGSEAHCLYYGQEYWYGGMLWHPEDKNLLLSGDRAFVVATER